MTMATSVAALLFLALATAGAGPAKPLDLRVEYMPCPVHGVQTTAPRLSYLPGHSDRAQSQSAYQIHVMQGASVVWNSGQVKSAKNYLLPYGGPALKADTTYTWNVTYWDAAGTASPPSDPATFSTGLFASSQWAGQWIQSAGQLRKAFSVNGAVTRASLFVSGIGYYELYCNGVKVGDHKLDVGWTDYKTVVWYSSYDLAPYLKPGTNVFAMFNGIGRWHKTPQAIVQANIETSAGRQSFVTDGTWKTVQGPISYNDLYNGEHYDARSVHNETEGWMDARFSDSTWPTATPVPDFNVTLTSQLFEPIRQVSEIEARTLDEAKPGMYVVDFGQNFAGWVRIRVRGPAGQVVQIRHAELRMHPPYGEVDGTLYYANLRGAKATELFTLKGTGDYEVYEPRFTQHGFRYIEVTGLSETPSISDFIGLEVHTDVRTTGEIAFSDEMLNSVQSLVYWGQKTNLMSVPTDCDQRDERMGWTGDAALTGENAIYNFDMGAFFTHWMTQMQNDQAPDGNVPNVIPGGGETKATNWATAYPTTVHNVWLYYGDEAIVKTHWASLQKYIAYWTGVRTRDGIANFQAGFGDWVPPPPVPKANGHLVAAFAHLRDLMLMADLAKVVGDHDAAREYRDTLDDLKDEFNAAFYDPARKCYGKGGATCLQTEQALPLWLGYVPEADLAAFLEYTVNDIVVKNTMHTTSGIVGLKFMFEALAQHNLHELPVALAQQTTYPSFGYMITNEYEPATTVWELWNSDSDGPGMNSRNHIMFGTVGSWFYKFLAGVQPTSAGYDTMAIAPSVVMKRNLTAVSADVGTPHGVAKVAWGHDTQTTSCGTAGESATLVLSCPSPIEGVDFASFGTPTGDCAKGFTASTCNAANTSSIVAKACVGKTSCSVPSNTKVFGDPCFGTKKLLAVALKCQGTEALLTVRITVPFGVMANVSVPLATLGPANATIVESNEQVWAGGAFHAPSAPGLKSARADAATNAVVFVAGSGNYLFSIEAAAAAE